MTCYRVLHINKSEVGEHLENLWFHETQKEYFIKRDYIVLYKSTDLVDSPVEVSHGMCTHIYIYSYIYYKCK